MNVPVTRWRAAAIAAASLLPFSAARSEPESTKRPAAQPTIAELIQRLEEQDQKIQALQQQLRVLEPQEQKQEEQDQKVLVLERKLEIQEEANKAALASTPVVKASARGFSIQSADGQNQIKLRGLVQTDGRFFTDDYAGDPPDTWQVTRARPILEGTLGGIYDFKFMPDFGQGKAIIQDAYMTARFLPQFQLTAGKFKSPVGLERLQSASDIRMVARAFPTQIAPNRDIGLQIGGSLAGDRASYAVAYLNGSNDGSSSDSFSPSDQDPNSDKEWAGRLFTLPFAESDVFALRGFGIGIASTYTDQEGTTSQTLLPTYKTSAQSNFFQYRTGATATIANGSRVRVAPQLYYYVGPFGLMAEYSHESQDVSRGTGPTYREATMDNYAWQVTASWFLTGEEESYKGYKPNTIFSLTDHTWGAWELVARYHVLNVDNAAFTGGATSFADPNTQASEASAWALGVNWYLNEAVKLVMDYEQTSFDGGAAGGTDREDEKVFLSRIQLGF
jgi:phosphate-selective porin OprO and OprP